MKKQSLISLLSIGMSLVMCFPAFAGTWSHEGSNWKYYNDNGKIEYSTWINHDNNWYYLDSAGSMKTGWVSVDDNWYFLHDDGTMAHDTWIDNYYVNSSGKWVKSQ